MRQRVTAVFVLIVLALAALDVVVLVSLRPQLDRAEELSAHNSDTALLVTRMRGHLRAMRAAAMGRRVHDMTGTAPSEETAAAFVTSRRSFESLSKEYATLEGHPEESELWAGISNVTFPAFVRMADRVMSQGEMPPLHDLVGIERVADEVDRQLQRIVEINSEEVSRSGGEIHSSIETLLAGCTALGLLGMIGGLLLGRWAIHAVRDYESSTEVRLQELDEFAGRVAHDLRNPLQSVAMGLTLVMRQTDDDRVRATCARAQDGARRMAEFIQELLTFARSGATPAPGVAARISDALREVQQDLELRAQQKNVRLNVVPAPDVYAAIGPEALRAILLNLADNAISHMLPRDEGSWVEISCSARSDVELIVRDNGEGIAPESVPRLFDSFFRASTRPGGFGIGLRTVKRLVDAHGGRVRVESEIGRGSTFTVVLPAAQPPAHERGARSEREDRVAVGGDPRAVDHRLDDPHALLR